MPAGERASPIQFDCDTWVTGQNRITVIRCWQWRRDSALDDGDDMGMAIAAGPANTFVAGAQSGCSMMQSPAVATSTLPPAADLPPNGTGGAKGGADDATGGADLIAQITQLITQLQALLGAAGGGPIPGSPIQAPGGGAALSPIGLPLGSSLDAPFSAPGMDGTFIPARWGATTDKQATVAKMVWTSISAMPLNLNDPPPALSERKPVDRSAFLSAWNSLTKSERSALLPHISTSLGYEASSLRDDLALIEQGTQAEIQFFGGREAIVAQVANRVAVLEPLMTVTGVSGPQRGNGGGGAQALDGTWTMTATMVDVTAALAAGKAFLAAR